jgi:hypothetical protein
MAKNHKMKHKPPEINLPLLELARRVFISGGISGRGILLLVVYYIKLIAVLPAGFLQFLFYSGRIKKTKITQPPIFILGHYRSGTTYLHKLLSADERFGFVSYYDMICPNSSLLFGNVLKNTLQFFIDTLKLKTPFFNNTIPSLDEPAEEERFLINKGSACADYWRFVFPLKKNTWRNNSQMDKAYYLRWQKEYLWLIKLMTYKNKGRQLILKSPPNTERIKSLLKIFPGAKFIYIYRNPYQVFYSTQNLWNRAIKKFCLQKITDDKINEIIFDNYIHLSEQYEKDKHLIPSANLVEVEYEELEANPFTVLRKIYRKLNIADFETINTKLTVQIEKEKKYVRFKYNYDEATLKKIQNRWARFLPEHKKTVGRLEKTTFEIF